MEISKKSRIWIYQSDRPFEAGEEQSIQNLLREFTGQWEAHGSKLAAAAEIRYNRFIILAVDEMQASASGCSIDKSVNLMKQIEQQFNVDLFNRFNIAWRDASGIHSASREEFEEKIKQGLVTENSIVFNNLIQTFEELGSKWEIPFKDSWHSQVFGEMTGA